MMDCAAAPVEDFAAVPVGVFAALPVCPEVPLGEEAAVCVLDAEVVAGLGAGFASFVAGTWNCPSQRRSTMAELWMNLSPGLLRRRSSSEEDGCCQDTYCNVG